MKNIPALAISIVLALSLRLAADEPKIHTQEIEEVKAGRTEIAKAAWWGFDPNNATQALQSAINSGAKKIIVEKKDSPWIVDKINLAGNQELIFEEGVIVEAKKDAFHGQNDSLFTAQNKSNIKLTGPGATLRMHRDDYAGSKYKKAEWRMALRICGCSNVSVSGLTLAESGGDGIYLGAGKNGETNKDIIIKDVVCDRNYSQGISVITAENLLIENCVMKNTRGTPPAAGIDFEPNTEKERLVNCVVRNCQFEDNQGWGIAVYMHQFSAATVPVSIRFENCVTRGANSGSFSIHGSCGSKGSLKGTVDVINCRFEDAQKAAFNFGDNASDGLKIRLSHCTLTDTSKNPTGRPFITFASSKGSAQDFGGIEFDQLVLKTTNNRLLLKYHNKANIPVRGVNGELIVEHNGQQTRHLVDQAFLDQCIAESAKAEKQANRKENK